MGVCVCSNKNDVNIILRVLEDNGLDPHVNTYLKKYEQDTVFFLKYCDTNFDNNFDNLLKNNDECSKMYHIHTISSTSTVRRITRPTSNDKRIIKCIAKYELLLADTDDFLSRVGLRYHIAYNLAQMGWI